jgi:hypothetical protein
MPVSLCLSGQHGVDIVSYPRKIYVASSWRNQHHNSVVLACRGLGHQVYDFKNPPNRAGFGWEQLDGDYKNWTPQKYIELLNHQLAIEGFNSDMEGLNWCDTCILLLPCGRSAHLEAGYAVGQGKSTVVFVSNEKFEPDLMYKMTSLVTCKIEEIYEYLGDANDKTRV